MLSASLQTVRARHRRLTSERTPQDQLLPYDLWLNATMSKGGAGRARVRH
jgi:hypothetical protein